MTTKVTSKKANIVQLVSGGKQALAQAQVQAYLEQPGSVTWIKAGDLLNEAFGSCVDGREEKCVIGNPGGDMAVLAEVVVSLGKLTRRHLTMIEFENIFLWALDTFDTFYMHTDTHGLEHLAHGLERDARIGRKFASVKEIEKYVRKPNPHEQIRLLDYLLSSDNIGCGHIKLMLKDPEAYGASRKVLRGLMKAFFDVLWNGTPEQRRKIEYRVLEGNHAEGAVVVISTAKKITDDTMIPMVRPTDGTTSIFVDHLQVSEYLHERVAMALAESGLFPEITKAQVKDLQKSMGEMMSTEIRETVSRLAWGLPIYQFELREK